MWYQNQKSHYSTLNVTLSNSKLNKLKYEIKNGTGVTLEPASNIFSRSSDEKNFQHKLLLTNTQVSWLRKAITNGSWANMKLSKPRLHNIAQWGGILVRLLEIRH